MSDHNLARRAVACKAWRWMPGMRPVHTDGLGYRYERVLTEAHAAEITGNKWYVPDLSDTLTALALLALVREAWGDGWLIEVQWYGSVHDAEAGWGVRATHFATGEVRWFRGPTEAEALVAALEATP